MKKMIMVLNSTLCLKNKLTRFFLGMLAVSTALISNADPVVLLNPITTPPPFPPSVPMLEPDDSYISYHYEKSGTGCWSYEPETPDIRLYTEVEEQIVHYKTNGTTTASSRSAEGDFQLIEYVCPSPTFILNTNYTACISSTDASCGTGPTYWYDDEYGGEPGGGSTLPSDIILYTNIDLPNGTLTIGNSFYYTVDPDVSVSGSCNPTVIFTGKGSLYDLYLTLTDSIIPYFPSPNGYPPPSVSATPSSSSSSGLSTASSGSFDSSGDFKFFFDAPSNTDYTVFASSDLQTWQNIGDQFFPGTNTYGNFEDDNAGNYSERYYLTTDGQGNISGVFGFVKISVTTNGMIIANPFLSSSTQIKNLLTNMPNGTIAQFWGDTNWAGTNLFSSGNWSDPSWLLTPGNALFLRPSTNTIVKFVGQVITGEITNFIPAGFSVRASALPLSGSLIDLGLTNFANGDYILKRNGSGYSAFTNISGIWYPSTPSLSLGEGIIINCASNTYWSQSYQGLTNIDVNTLTTVELDAYYYGDHPYDGGYVYATCPYSSWWGDAPDGSVCEIYTVYGGALFASAPATSDFLDGQGEIDFSVSPDDEGEYIYARYRNGNICGPWSDQLSESIIPY